MAKKLINTEVKLGKGTLLYEAVAELEVPSNKQKILDTRNSNELPSWYYQNYPTYAVTEMKDCASIGITGYAGFVVVETRVAWSDTSVPITQIAYYTRTRTIWYRISSGNTWGAWLMVNP